MTLKSISNLIDRHKAVDNLRKTVNNSPASTLKLVVSSGVSDKLTRIQIAKGFIRTNAELRCGIMFFGVLLLRWQKQRLEG